MWHEDQDLVIVSRQSQLALAQTQIVVEQLRIIAPNLRTKILAIKSSGDQILDQPLHKVGGKGLFVKELEQALLSGQAHIAVHSMKDLPAQAPAGLVIGAIMQRADPRDILVSSKYRDLTALPVAAVIGTSSLRRQAQLLHLRPDCNVKYLRGNINTRLEQLYAGKFDAIVLAAAGVQRLALRPPMLSTFTLEQMLPAVGQGALGVQYNVTQTKVGTLVAQLNDYQTATCVQAERSMNAVLDGGCHAPIAGFAAISENVLELRGLVASLDGTRRCVAVVAGPIHDAESIGVQVATELLAQGAANIIAELNHHD